MVKKIYELTANFPNDEKFGLVSQLRRAVICFPSNIAEGAGRNNQKEFIQFLYITLSFVTETETQLIIADKLVMLKNYAEINDELKNIQKNVYELDQTPQNKPIAKIDQSRITNHE